MKNTFGNSIALTLFGESHGAAVGAVLDGLAPGIPVGEEEIRNLLERRRPASRLDTARREQDEYSIVSGVWNGKTTGTPLTILIPNRDTRSGDYHYGTARPSHADYTAFCKYHGYEDYRGGGHFSGRVTAALVAAGGIPIPALREKGIRIGTHILRCGTVEDRSFNNPEEDCSLLEKRQFPTLDPDVGAKMQESILKAAENGDSVGGCTQTVLAGLPAGIGEPWFDSAEGVLSHALFSIGGIKGIEFGLGFGFAGKTGSEANDPFRIRDGRIVTAKNDSGGINGGIANGMPVVFQCAVRPTPSIRTAQDTVDFIRWEETELRIEGRHDPAIIRRICPVIDSVTALASADLLAVRYGTDWLAGERAE